MKENFKNVIATKFEVESPWRRKKIFGWERKIGGFPTCRKLSNGALYEKTGHIIHDSIRKGGIFGDYVVSIAPIVIDPEIKVSSVLTGKCAFLGNLYSQYGHFITEGISRLHDFENLNQYDHLLMYPFIFDDYKTELKFYHKYFYEKLGIDFSKIKFISDSCRIEDVTVYKQLWTINDSVDESISSVYDHLRDKIPSVKKQGLKYYLSRHKSDRVLNLKQIEEVFFKNSFEIVYPEDLSMEQQMEIYTGSNLIISLSGSSVHNVIFGREHSCFVEIGDTRTPNEPHPMQQLVNSLSVANYQFLPFHSGDSENWDLAELEKLVKSL